MSDLFGRKRIRKLSDALAKQYARWDILWGDHLRRCDCHDSWDQCPCTEVGHADRAARLACPNKCCPWCAVGEEER